MYFGGIFGLLLVLHCALFRGFSLYILFMLHSCVCVFLCFFCDYPFLTLWCFAYFVLGFVPFCAILCLFCFIQLPNGWQFSDTNAKAHVLLQSHFSRTALSTDLRADQKVRRRFHELDLQPFFLQNDLQNDPTPLQFEAALSRTGCICCICIGVAVVLMRFFSYCRHDHTIVSLRNAC